MTMIVEDIWGTVRKDENTMQLQTLRNIQVYVVSTRRGHKYLYMHIIYVCVYMCVHMYVYIEECDICK